MMKLLQNKRGLIGVDVGVGCVKVAQLARRSNVLVLERALAIDRLPAPSSKTHSRREFTLHEVDNLLRACDQFSGSNSAIVLSMAACEVNSEAIDSNTPPAALADIAAQVAKRESGFGGRARHDFWQSDTGRANSRSLHVVATPERLTREVAKQHRAVGWTCGAIDGLPTALARAVRLSGLRDDVPIAAIDWGWSRVTICLVWRGETLFVRSFADGAFATIVEPLCRKLNLTSLEAQQLLASSGVTTRSGEHQSKKVQAVIGDAAAPALRAFQQELSRTLSFLKGRQRECFPEKIVLFGGGATIANITEYTSQQFDMEAVVWDYPHVDVTKAHSWRVPMPLLGPAVALSALAWESA